MDLDVFFIRTIAAAGAGLLIGIEREIQNKSAGLKTNSLVALGAAVFVTISLSFYGDQNVDITRVIGQVVTGIGFIGAGVILHRGGIIRGLTTAATVWCSAAAGCLAAVGEFQELFLLTALIIFINISLEPLEKFIDNLRPTKKERKED